MILAENRRHAAGYAEIFRFDPVTADKTLLQMWGPTMRQSTGALDTADSQIVWCGDGVPVQRIRVGNGGQLGTEVSGDTRLHDVLGPGLVYDSRRDRFTGWGAGDHARALPPEQGRLGVDHRDPRGRRHPSAHQRSRRVRALPVRAGVRRVHPRGDRRRAGPHVRARRLVALIRRWRVRGPRATSRARPAPPPRGRGRSARARRPRRRTRTDPAPRSRAPRRHARRPSS